MGTLFDALSQKLSGDPDAAPTQVAPQQDQLLAGLRAKTGKATASSTPGGSNLGEQTALDAAQTQQQQATSAGRLAGAQVATQAAGQAQTTADAQKGLATDTQNQMAGLATQGAIQSSQTAAAEQQANSQTSYNETAKAQALNAQAYTTLQQLAADKQLSVDNIWRDFHASEQDLAYRKDAAQIEQVGFLLSLRDQSYVDELNRVGQERMLDDKINYNDESARLAMGDQLDSLVQQLGFKTSLNADQRTWDTKLAGMSIDAAMQISQAAITASSQNMMISGAGTMAKAGVDAYFNKSPTPKGQFDDNGQGKSDSISDDYTLKNDESDTSDDASIGGAVGNAEVTT